MSAAMTGEPDNAYVEVRELELMVRVGVPDAERAQPQRLTISIRLWPIKPFAELQDDIGNAIDYAAVACDVQELVNRREDRLIETLADVVADHLLRSYHISRVRIELRKFVLDDAKHTAVVLVRSRARGA